MLFGKMTILNYPYQGPFSNEKNLTEKVEDIFFKVLDLALRFQISENLTGILLLWALLREPQHLTHSVIRSMGVTYNKLEEDVININKASFGINNNSVIDFRYICQILATAIKEAQNFGLSYVGTEHLMLALLKEEDIVLKKVFHDHNLTYDGFKSAISLLENKPYSN